MTNTKPTDTYDPRWLALILRMLGTGFLLFFGIAALMIFTKMDQSLLQSEFGRLLVRLVRWGDLDGGAEHYELMVCVIYIVWGCYLWIAAANPLSHKLFLDFSVAANVAHFGLMFFQGLLMPHEHIHLVGDVLLGWVGLGVLIAFWLPARKYAA